MPEEALSNDVKEESFRVNDLTESERTEGAQEASEAEHETCAEESTDSHVHTEQRSSSVSSDQNVIGRSLEAADGKTHHADRDGDAEENCDAAETCAAAATDVVSSGVDAVSVATHDESEVILPTKTSCHEVTQEVTHDVASHLNVVTTSSVNDELSAASDTSTLTINSLSVVVCDTFTLSDWTASDLGTYCFSLCFSSLHVVNIVSVCLIARPFVVTIF